MGVFVVLLVRDFVGGFQRRALLVPALRKGEAREVVGKWPEKERGRSPGRQQQGVCMRPLIRG